MAWFKKKLEKREVTLEMDDALLSAILNPDTIGVSEAMQIPSLAGCVDLISKTVAMLPIKLFKEADGKVKEVQDNRISLLNDDTKDTLDGYQFKKALVEDYLLNGAGYAYINKDRNKVKSLHYVKNSNVHITENVDAIFKKYDILVQGKSYRPFEFLKLTRKTVNGVKGIGLVSEHNGILAVCYNSLVYENIIAKTGGNKKGFLKSAGKLSAEAITALKTAWANLYSNNGENVVVLNNGLDFQEANNTSVELQMNENKKTNSIEICKLATVPPSVLDGTANESDNRNFFKQCILPILKAFETALNKDLLLEAEKGTLYFAFDTKEMLKGDIEGRYKAYSEAVKSGWLSKNEIRYIEDYEAIDGLDVVTMSLGDVIFDIRTKKYFTPNMDSITSSSMNQKGGENVED